MQRYQLNLMPQSAFITPLRGDTLFGHFCWAIRESEGDQALIELLNHYEKTPFIVIADPSPLNRMPNPTVPLHLKGQVDNRAQRKQLKKSQWLPDTVWQYPLSQWLNHALDEHPDQMEPPEQHYQQMHNSINRLTETTGQGFDPFVLNKYHHQNQTLNLQFAIDEQQMPLEKTLQLFEVIGLAGYGRKASTGHGKFTIENCQPHKAHHSNNANAYLTLNASAPEGSKWRAEQSFYELETHWGKHGNQLVHGNPFKNPILLIKRGALLMPKNYQPDTQIIGQAIGGGGSAEKTLSINEPRTYHQGYALIEHVYFDGAN